LGVSAAITREYLVKPLLEAILTVAVANVPTSALAALEYV
jgi:hypothetical protein